MKKKYYKLTTQDLATYGGFKWEIGKTYKTDGSGDLCGPGWLHCYTSPLLAVLLNPIHADIKNPRLFEVKTGGEFKDDSGLKCGFTEMALVKELELPVITVEQRVKFALLCAMKVYKEKAFTLWAKNWINGKDRSADAARAAARAAARVAARVAARAAARAAARSAADAAGAADAAARAAKIDLIKLAKKAME